MPCDSSESRAAHIDLHRLFYCMSNAEYICRCKDGSPGWVGGGGSQKGRERCGRVKKWLRVEYCELGKAGETNSWMSACWKEKNGDGEGRGKQEGCCKRTHVLPGDLHPKEILWSLLLFVCLLVCECVNSRWCLYELSHSLFMMAPHWQ